MKIQTIFEAFENFKLGRNSLDVLYSWIVTGLEKVISPGGVTFCFRLVTSHFHSLKGYLGQPVGCNL